MIGSLLFGFVWAISYEKGWISEQVRLPILVGFMGAFTTYSTFVLIIINYLKIINGVHCQLIF